MRLNTIHIKTIILFLGLMLPTGLQAQKKEIAAAKANLKAGSNLPQTETSMRTLLADSANRHNEKIWTLMASAIKKQYEEGNEKLYLKQNYDTAQIFLHAYRLYKAYEDFDTIDAIPNKNGEVKPKYRKKHATELLGYKKNVYTGGNFFLKKQRYTEACQMFEIYLSTGTHQLFAGYPELEEDTLMSRVAYLALFSAYKSKQYDKVEQYYKLACLDNPNLSNTITWMAEVRNEQQRKEDYIALLQEGFELFPTNKYFFSNLFSNYLGMSEIDDADKMVNRLLEIDAKNRKYRFSKTAVLLYQERYDECVKICDQLIEEDETDSSPYLNAGLALYRSAEPYAKSKINSLFNKQKACEIYKAALTYLERFKKMKPDAAELWAMPLYHIYLNLNMGKEFEEIETIIKDNPDIIHEHD